MPAPFCEVRLINREIGLYPLYLGVQTPSSIHALQVGGVIRLCQVTPCFLRFWPLNQILASVSASRVLTVRHLRCGARCNVSPVRTQYILTLKVPETWPLMHCMQWWACIVHCGLIIKGGLCGNPI